MGEQTRRTCRARANGRNGCRSYNHGFYPLFFAVFVTFEGGAPEGILCHSARMWAMEFPMDHVKISRGLGIRRPPPGELCHVFAFCEAPLGVNFFFGWGQKICTPSFGPPVVLPPSAFRYEHPLCVFCSGVAVHESYNFRPSGIVAYSGPFVVVDCVGDPALCSATARASRSAAKVVSRSLILLAVG
jgi:hypothetical protein